MNVEIGQITTRPPEQTRIMSIPSPNSYFSYPDLVCLEPIPLHIFSVLAPLWRRSIHTGKTVELYRFSNVFVAKEGLVFDETTKLIDVTRTYHEDDSIFDAWLSVRERIKSSHFPSLPRGILAKSRGSSNYGHFLVEMLPRAWVARIQLQLKEWPAIIDSTSAAVRTVSTQALRQAGFSSNEVVAIDQEPVFIGELIVVDGLTCHSQYL